MPGTDGLRWQSAMASAAGASARPLHRGPPPLVAGLERRGYCRRAARRGPPAGRKDTVPSRIDIDDFLAQRHIALVGVSTDSRQFPNAVYRMLRDGGRTMVPVNRGVADGAAIEGDRAYRSLAEVPGTLDGVVVMVGADAAADVVRDAVARGVPRVWLHRGVGKGSVSPEAVALCRHNGVRVVDGACPFMFAAPVTGIHGLHRALSVRRVLRRAA